MVMRRVVYARCRHAHQSGVAVVVHELHFIFLRLRCHGLRCYELRRLKQVMLSGSRRRRLVVDVWRSVSVRTMWVRVEHLLVDVRRREMQVACRQLMNLAIGELDAGARVH